MKDGCDRAKGGSDLGVAVGQSRVWRFAAEPGNGSESNVLCAAQSSRCFRTTVGAVVWQNIQGERAVWCG